MSDQHDPVSAVFLGWILLPYLMIWYWNITTGQPHGRAWTSQRYVICCGVFPTIRHVLFGARILNQTVLSTRLISSYRLALFRLPTERGASSVAFTMYFNWIFCVPYLGLSCQFLGRWSPYNRQSTCRYSIEAHIAPITCPMFCCIRPCSPDSWPTATWSRFIFALGLPEHRERSQWPCS